MSTLRTLMVRAFLGATATLLVAIGVVAPAFSQEAPRELALAHNGLGAEGSDCSRISGLLVQRSGSGP